MDKIAVLIPCYNEEKTIAKVVSDVKKFLPQAVTYVYDNNSTDRTVELATEAGAIVRYEYAQGKGNVIRRMFREIDAECYLMIDGDDTYPLDCAQEMVDRVLQHQADMVVGDRLSSTYFTENKRPFHNFGNSLMRAGINSLFHANIKDIMTGYRAFSYEFVKTFPVFSKGFEIETEMTIHAVNYNMQVENVVVEYRDRPQGSESKLNTYSDGFRVIRKMMQLYKNYKPLHFFGMLALLLIAVSVILFVPVFLEYLNTGLVPRFPTLIACGFILLAGIQSFFAGIASMGSIRCVKGCNMQEKKILPRRKGVVLLSVLGCLFVFFAKTEKDLASAGNILWTAGYIGSTLLWTVVLGCLLGFLGTWVVHRLWNRAQTAEDTGKKQAAWYARLSAWLQRRSGVQIFFGSLLFLLLAWLPVYLAYYPGICAYDAPVQTGQIMEHYYFDHHPIVHTLFLQGMLWLGSHIFGSVNAGMAFYTAVQMLLLSGSMAYGMLVLHHRKTAAGWQLAIQLLGMFFPFHWYMSVSMTKDTVFSVFLLLQLVSLADLLWEDRNAWRPGIRDLLFALGTVGMILFRNNGKYAMIVLLAFTFLTFCFGKKARKLWGRLLVVCGAAFCVGLFVLSAVFSVTHAEQGDRREMLSMPIQQLSRCMIYHGGVSVLAEDDNTMDAADKALINDFILDEAYRDYDPGIADPVKRHTNTYVARYRSGEFIRVYLHLLTQYPGDMINAALATNAGFLSPFDTTHADVNRVEGRAGLSYVQTRWEEDTLNDRGIYKDSKWPWLFEQLESWAENNSYLRTPVLKYLFVPGSYLWLYLALAAVLVIVDRKRFCLPLAIVAGYYGTMLFGPTVQMRYVYPVMLALPYVLALVTGRRKNG